MFTVEYSVRGAMHAVYRLLGLDRSVPPVHHALLDPKTAFQALKTAFGPRRRGSPAGRPPLPHHRGTSGPRRRPGRPWTRPLISATLVRTRTWRHSPDTAREPEYYP
ncbi:hypothetical protein [Kitasatospora cathayae]|uniref:Uncharacterized protein n=1 Tax=Kitasatospora cathayae TaxID=3004092 RepID=A0ABY7QGS4_9ACTN|nr:hypothetical protein [Kitasatospora sp. HUAS 3-15]WBP91464.1 hypothetical protein O1G21_05235 [Kitasatospora sp. HUAS 3-15]